MPLTDLTVNGNTAKVVFLGGPLHREFHRLACPFPEVWSTQVGLIRHTYLRTIFHIRPTEFRIAYTNSDVNDDDAKWALRDIYPDCTPGGL